MPESTTIQFLLPTSLGDAVDIGNAATFQNFQKASDFFEITVTALATITGAEYNALSAIILPHLNSKEAGLLYSCQVSEGNFLRIEAVDQESALVILTTKTKCTTILNALCKKVKIIITFFSSETLKFGEVLISNAA